MLLKNMESKLKAAGYVVKKPMTKAEAGRLGGRKSSPAKRAAAAANARRRWQAKAKPIPAPEIAEKGGSSPEVGAVAA